MLTIKHSPSNYGRLIKVNTNTNINGKCALAFSDCVCVSVLAW